LATDVALESRQFSWIHVESGSITAHLDGEIDRVTLIPEFNFGYAIASATRHPKAIRPVSEGPKGM